MDEQDIPSAELNESHHDKRHFLRSAAQDEIDVRFSWMSQEQRFKDIEAEVTGRPPLSERIGQVGSKVGGAVVRYFSSRGTPSTWLS